MKKIPKESRRILRNPFGSGLRATCEVEIMQPIIIYSDFIYNLPTLSRITVCEISAFKGRKVGVVVTHPDDTLTTTAIHLMAKQGAIVTLFIATSGNHAPILGVSQAAERAAIRQCEAKMEAEVLQLPKPEFLNLPFYEEGRPPNTDDFRIMAQHLAQRPLDVLLLPAEGLYKDYKEGHPSHLAVAELALEALKDYPRKVKIFYYDSPWALLKNCDINAIFPLPPEVILKRLEGIKSHHSQITRTPFDSFALNLAEIRAAIIPEVIGINGLFPLGRYLEVYHVEP